jgi:hypothetical protein
LCKCPKNKFESDRGAASSYAPFARLGAPRAAGRVPFLAALAPVYAGGAKSCAVDWDSIGEVCLSHAPDGELYSHDVLGVTPEWQNLSVMSPDPLHAITTLCQPGHIFEDIVLRLADVTGD